MTKLTDKEKKAIIDELTSYSCRDLPEQNAALEHTEIKEMDNFVEKINDVLKSLVDVELI